MTIRSLLEDLPADRLSAIAARLDTPRAAWYLSALTAVGAWMAAGSLIAFLFIAGAVEEELVVGGMLIVAAVGMRRVWRGLFAEQLALALSVAGHVIVFIGMDEVQGAAMAACVLAAVLYRLYPDGLHRFLSSTTALMLLLMWATTDDSGLGLDALLLAEVAALALLQSRPALMYALAASIPVTILVIQSYVSPIPAAVILTGALVALAWWAVPEMDPRVRRLLYGATVLLGALSTPGILAAIALLVLGYARGDRVLMGIALIFLPVFIVYFYYNLEIGLGVKSYVLMGSGITLLVLRRML